MTKKAELTAIGLMSGTSLDGIDVALLRTDGETVEHLGPTYFQPYSRAQTMRLRMLLDMAAEQGRGLFGSPVVHAVEQDLTRAHARAVESLLEGAGLDTDAIDLVGFHGQTLLHRPVEGWTWQIGDGALLAQELGIPVVNDFRSADVAAGGEGAPLVPLYHQALLRSAGLADDDWPVAILNIGGVANITYLDRDGGVIAFDTGPGNALINDWLQTHTGAELDLDGALAASGRVDDSVVAAALSHPYFTRAFPKSLDRNDFPIDMVAALSPEDGAATLTALTVATIAASRKIMPTAPGRWLVCGGGRKNPVIMEGLQRTVQVPVDPVEAVGLRGDFLEAEAFAFLAVRSAKGMPLSLPTTTGVSEPLTGGRLYRAG
ncbi:anhydro-N-acetylmuramic acid kinase [Iodidimonas sp. SYSU 1G8]|uniref:anhydro-N-acetylmuramic acid kinase n=1 Tax=Iodidimonas sp. SYSU 1G8 TaxID=3133967 RepID=UPI0031FEFA7D